MSYSELADYRDSLLKEFVDDAYIADSDEEVNVFVKSLGVLPADIVTPYPHSLKKLAQALTYYAVAGDKSMMNAVTSEAGAGKDSYEYKRAYWATEVNRFKELLTAGILLGTSDGVATTVTFPFSIPMQRA